MGFTEVTERPQVQMELRTSKLRRGDTIIEQVADRDHPYREVVLIEHPTTDVMTYEGHDVPVKYLKGTDARTGRLVQYTGTEFTYWQIVRQF